ncbi:unnamed protein product, partial [Symbiodinium sp. CCMP2456]
MLWISLPSDGSGFSAGGVGFDFDTGGPLWRRWVVAAIKFAFLALVLAFVAQTFRDGLRDLSQQKLTFSWSHLVAACVAYALAQLTMGVFWRRVLAAIGRPTKLTEALSTYYISQPGKYVPGKASVILIRATRLHSAAMRSGEHADYKTSLVAAGASSFYETLCFMSVGAILAAGLIPLVDGTDELRWLTPASLALALVCLAPAAPPAFRWLLGRFTASSGRAELRDRLRQSLGYDLAACGVLSALGAWCLLSVFLWLTAEAIGMAGGRGVADLPFWTLAATLPTAAGFVSLLPAGIGVREAVSLAVLAPVIGDGGAVAVTAASRLLGVATE